MEKKNNLQENILGTSAISIVGGVTMGMFGAVGIGGMLLALGLGGIGYYAVSYSKLDRLFKNVNLCAGGAYPILKDKKKTQYSTIYTYTMPSGLCEDDFLCEQDAIEQYLGKDVEIKYTHKAIQIEVFNNQINRVIPFEVQHCRGAVEFPVGIDHKGEMVFADLSKNEPHALVCGEPGSGKSVMLRSIITYLILEKDVDLHLLDYKMGAEFRVFENCEKVKSFAINPAEGTRLLNQMQEEVNRRYKLIADANCVNIQEYNAKYPALKYQVIIIDEFAEMADSKDGNTLLQSITSRARACGCSVILSTQRPSADVVNGRIKANIGTIIGLKTMNELNSRVIIDDAGLEKLKGNGHAIVRHNGKETEVQGMYLTVEQARELVKHTYIDKSKTPEVPENVDL